MSAVSLTVNGIRHALDVEARTTLIEVLREVLGLTGAKEACGVGECGNCMVLMNGRPIPSCLVLAVDARDGDIETIEGLASDGELHQVQAAFVEHGAFQCGFCTPGMVIAATALLRERPTAGPDEVRTALAGVLCRCGSYPRVVAAVTALARKGDG